MTSAARSLDEVDGERGSHIAGDQRLLDLVPGRAVGGPEIPAELCHERAAGLLEPFVERVGRRDGEERGRVERRVCGHVGLGGWRVRLLGGWGGAPLERQLVCPLHRDGLGRDRSFEVDRIVWRRRR